MICASATGRGAAALGRVRAWAKRYGFGKAAPTVPVGEKGVGNLFQRRLPVHSVELVLPFSTARRGDFVCDSGVSSRRCAGRRQVRSGDRGQTASAEGAASWQRKNPCARRAEVFFAEDRQARLRGRGVRKLPPKVQP